MGVLIYILPILIAIGLGLAQFGAGKRQIANLVELALGPGNEVRFGDFSGSPFDLRLDDMTIRDAEGVWFDLDGFRFRWAPSALLRGRLVIEEVSIASLALARLPETEAKPAPEAGKPFEIPGLPGPLRGLAVERLAVPKLTLGAPVLGERAVFALEGSLEAKDPREQFALALRLEREDEPTAGLAATAELKPPGEREGAAPVLTVDIEAEERGGLLAALAGTPDSADLALSLEGTAPVADWRGRLVGRAGGLGRVEAELGLRAEADLSAFTATADGTLDLAPRLLPDGAAPLLEPKMRFALRLRRPEDDDRLIVERLAVSTEAADLEAEARLDFAERTTEGRFALRIPRLSALEGLAKTPLAGTLAATGRFAGPLSLPETTVDLTVGDLQGPGIAAERFTGTLKLARLDEAGETSPGLRLDGDGRIQDLVVEGTPPRGQRDFAWTLGLDLPDGGPIGLRRLSLTGDAVSFAAAGRLDGEDFAVDATVDIADLRGLAGLELVGPELAGLPTAPRLRVEAEGSLAQPLTAAITGRLDRLEPLPPALAALLGHELAFAADLALADGTRLTVSDARIDAMASSLTAAAALDLEARRVEAARFGMTVPRLAALAPALDPDLGGRVRLEGRASGPFGDLRVTAEAEGREVAVAGLAFDKIAADLRADGLPAAPSGQIELALAKDGERLVLRSGFGLAEGRLRLTDLGLETAGTALAGQVTIALEPFLAEGELRGRSTDLAPLTAFFGPAIGGRAELDLRLAAGAAGGQAVALRLSAADVAASFGRIGSVRLDADIRNATADPSGAAEIAVAGFRSAGATVADATLRATGGLDRARFEIDADGTARAKPFRVETHGTTAASPDGRRLELAALDGRYGDVPVALRRPAAVRFTADGFAIESLDLGVGDGHVTASGALGQESVELAGRIEDLSLALLGAFGAPDLAGQLDGRLSIAGRPQAPEAAIELRASDVRPGGAAGRDLPPLQMAARARVADGRLDGRLTVEGLAPKPAEATLAVPLAFSLAPVSFNLPPEEAIQGTVSAAVDLDRLEPFLALEDQRLDGLFRLAAEIGGTPRVPEIDGQARLVDGLYANERTGTVLKDFDIAFRGRGTELVIERLNATDGEGGLIAAEGRVDLAPSEDLPFEARLTLRDAVLVRRPAPVPVDGRLTLSGTRAAVALDGDLSLTDQRVALAIDASARPAERTIDGELVVEAPELSRLSALAGIALEGAARLRAELAGDLQRVLEARLEGRLRDFGSDAPALAALAGPETAFEATARLTGGTELDLTKLALTGAAVAVEASGTADLADRDLAGRFAASLPDLAPLSAAAGMPLGGSLQANGTLGGTFDAATLSLDATGRDIRVRDRRFARLTAEAQARGLPAAPVGEVRLRLRQAGQTVEMASAFALADGRLSLPDLELKAPGTAVAGALAIDLGGPLIEGRLQGHAADLAALSPLTGQPFGGQASFEARFAPAEGGQGVAAELSGRGLSGPFGSVGEIEATARVRDLFAGPRGQATVALTALRRGEIAVERLSIEADGGARALRFAAEARGRARAPFELDTAGQFAAAPDGGRVTLARLTGSYAEEPFELTEPAVLRFSSGGVALDRLALTVAGGRLTASARYGPETVTLEARLGDLPLDLASRFGAPPLSGRASAELSVTGPLRQPQADLDLDIAGLKLEGRAYGDAPPMDLRLEAALRDGRLRAELRASGPFDSPAVVQAGLPLALSLRPFAVSIPPDGAIDGRLRAEAALPRIASLLLLDDQRLKGRLEVELGLSGTVANPRLNGGASIVDGVYQNLVTGTVLADIQAALAANGTAVTVERFTATDGAKGTLTASGALDLAAGGGSFPIALDLAFDDAVLVRRDDAVAAADGELAFTGSLGGDALLSGEVAVGPAQIRIPDRLPPSVVDLDVIEIGETGEIITRPEAGEKLLVTDAVRLRLAVTAERVFVRGRGLESEWEGRLRIAGTAAAPKITGRLQVERGFVDFLGSRLDVTRGVISFPGARPPAPNIDIVATADAGDGVTARLALSGDASSPELVVGSQPALPQDEVLARLLFGRDLSSITPLQAVKLAAAVNTLRGGGGVDLLGQTRELLGVDVVDIRTEQETAGAEGAEGGEASTTVGLGKYVTEDIFVEVERGLANDSGAVSVEIEVTPNITIDTEVGADARAGVGVKWRYDY